MRSLIYGNTTTQKPSETVGGGSYTFPTLIAAQDWTIALRFTERVDGAISEFFPTIRSISANIGPKEVPPVGGQIRWQIGNGVSTVANTTAAFDWNFPAHEIVALLNALSGGPGDFSVEQTDGSYFVRRGTGEKVEITPRGNRLSPLSFARVRYSKRDGDWTTEIRYVQSALAFTDVAEPVLPKQPYIETVVDGYTDDSGTYRVNEVQNLIIPPDFRGQFYLKRNNIRTALFSIDDGAEEFQTGLNALLLREEARVTVTNPDDGLARIEFGGSLAGINVEPLEVEVPVEGTPPGDWTLTLDLGKDEMLSALRGKPEIIVPFEVEIEVPVDESDPEGPTKIVKLWQENVKIIPPLTWEGMATSQTIDWLRPPSPKDYRRFSPSTIISGQQHYVATFGDAVATEFEFTHNLGTADISGLEVIDNETGAMFVRGSDYFVIGSTESTVTIEFPDAPSADSLYVVITTAGPVSAFIAGLELEIPQVIGLEESLNELFSRVVVLEGILPSVAGAGVSTPGNSMEILIPETEELLHYRAAESVFGQGGIILSKIPSNRPYLLPAIHDATASNSTLSPLPDIAANAGQVLTSTAGAAVLIPGGGSIRSAYVKTGGFVGSDGRMLYPVGNEAGTKSYYPKAFDRELFLAAISEDQLRLGKTFEVSFGIQTLLINPDCAAQWVIKIELGTAPQDTTPSPIGLNLQNIVWASTAALQQRIILTPLLTSHLGFGLRISRGLSEIKCDKLVYGNWLGNNSAAPATGNFVIRGSLCQFDTENAATAARGWVYRKLTGSVTIDEEGRQNTKPARMIIY